MPSTRRTPRRRRRRRKEEGGGGGRFNQANAVNEERGQGDIVVCHVTLLSVT